MKGFSFMGYTLGSPEASPRASNFTTGVRPPRHKELPARVNGGGYGG